MKRITIILLLILNLFVLHCQTREETGICETYILMALYLQSKSSKTQEEKDKSIQELIGLGCLAAPRHEPISSF